MMKTKWPFLIIFNFAIATIGLYFFYYNHPPILAPLTHPFNYGLCVKTIRCNPNLDDVTICCHGYGHNSNLVYILNKYQVPMGHLVGFNFPDHDILATDNHESTHFGSINENWF